MTSTNNKIDLPTGKGEFATWLGKINLGRQAAGGKAAYVPVDDEFYHVASAPEGELVSKVQWVPDQEHEGHLRPRLNMFVVTHPQRMLAIESWNMINNTHDESHKVDRHAVTSGRMR